MTTIPFEPEDCPDSETEALRAEARREEVRALSSMEGMDLADPDVMSEAWMKIQPTV
jgi:hypothetical protein